MRRRLASIAVLLGFAAILTACSPPHIGTIGIQRTDDGTLIVLVRICRHSVDTLIVNAVNSYPHSEDGESLSQGWESVPNIENPLNPAVESAADVPFPVSEQALQTDVLYELWAAGRQGNAFSGLFGASELAALRPGEVLAQPMRDDVDSDHVRDGGRGGSFMTVTFDDFEHRAEAFCA